MTCLHSVFFFIRYKYILKDRALKGLKTGLIEGEIRQKKRLPETFREGVQNK